MKVIYFLIVFGLIGSTYAQTNRGGFLYQFHDSSVPPPYHRSYLIDIEDTVVMFRVDSYGDLLLDEKYSVTQLQLEQFIKKLKACNLKNIAAKDEPNGCTGGTSDSFFFMWDGTTPWDGYTSKCGGKEYGNLKGKIEEARQLFKSMVPDFETRLQSTRN